ncbi:unnamed protein product [Hymenolepis diminuta]|uniref:Lebercilin domain-containing protein n=1 Tax=Hymenolepis diminuta TaxID=6216 RepID=A0A0R3SEC1_HYMDI|nr:unnamed protein product [Hymenolepis diminuta]
MKDKTDFSTEFPQFRSPCPTKDEIFRDYGEKEKVKNLSPSSKYFSHNNVHWIPPPAKTTKPVKRTKSVKNIDVSRSRRSRSWSHSDEEINKKDEERPRNWTKFVDDIDRSIENLSHSVQGLLKNAKSEKEKIHFEHTPVKDTPICDRDPRVFHHSPIEDFISCGEVDRLTRELQQTKALKSHLQLQLRQRSAQCDRIVAQMRNSESKTRQTVVKLTQQLADADIRIQELTKQRDLLKHAAKGQKKRAIKAEEEIARLRGSNGGNAEKRNEDDAAKAIAYLEEHNKQLRELADSYEERLAITEKEVGKLRERLSQTGEAGLTTHDGNERPSPDKATEMELTIRDLQEKLAQSDASNKNLQAYLAFLKHSYSSIFDEGDEKKDVPVTSAVVTMATPEIRRSNDASPGLIE